MDSKGVQEMRGTGGKGRKKFGGSGGGEIWVTGQIGRDDEGGWSEREWWGWRKNLEWM